MPCGEVLRIQSTSKCSLTDLQNYDSDLLGSTTSSVADNRVGRPEQRMGVGKVGLAGRVGVTRTVQHRDHRLPQRLAAGDILVGRLPLEQVGDKLARRLGMH